MEKEEKKHSLKYGFSTKQNNPQESSYSYKVKDKSKTCSCKGFKPQSLDFYIVEEWVFLYDVTPIVCPTICNTILYKQT